MSKEVLLIFVFGVGFIAYIAFIIKGCFPDKKKAGFLAGYMGLLWFVIIVVFALAADFEMSAIKSLLISMIVSMAFAMITKRDILCLLKGN